ncbi:hypothetical protein B0H39_002008 [Clostridium beijerinckii]|nr:hypothetical protein [Clostridium beijerinckii]
MGNIIKINMYAEMNKKKNVKLDVNVNMKVHKSSNMEM